MRLLLACGSVCPRRQPGVARRLPHVKPVGAAWVLLAACLAAVPAQAQTPTSPTRTVAVLPLKVEAPGLQDAAPLLAAALSEELAGLGHYKVISADEIATLLQEEAQLQSVGSTEGALQEAVGAMGAELMAVGVLQRVAGHHVWSTTLVQSSNGNAVMRAQVEGPGVQALLAQTREMALLLAGRGEEAELKGLRGARRLGFTNEEDLQAFKRYRDENPGLTTGEALTRFITLHNTESTRLAVAQALVFTVPVVFLALAAGMFGAILGSIPYSWGTPGAVVLSSLGLGVLLAAPVVVAFQLVGLALVVVDLLDLGRVTVTADGCCRDDSEIREARARNGMRKAAELWTALTGPASCLGLVGAYTVGVTLSSVVGFFIPPQPRSDLAALTGLMFYASIPCLCGMCLVSPLTSVTAGLVTLLWPERDAVDEPRPDVEEVAR
ncbi:MAG: hypothetical protein AB2A00_25525 [Myxococcota bacterium]